ncbi:MAG: glutaminyl-peptide cyclotransferase [Kiritimatiellia bacterium]
MGCTNKFVGRERSSDLAATQRPFAFILAICALLLITSACTRAPETLTAKIIASRPHDPSAYTQGLQWHNGRLWESTGLYGQSSVREVDPATGEVLRKSNLPDRYFGEGLTWHDDELWLLTWREKTAFVLDPETFSARRELAFTGEGWGLTSDGEHLIMSDGTSRLRFMEPSSLSLIRELAVTENDVPLSNLNELEFIEGQIFANVYLTDRIVRIHPGNGRVTASLDLSKLRSLLPQPHQAEVLNGIAFDAMRGTLLVTGKRWPVLFELELKSQSR